MRTRGLERSRVRARGQAHHVQHDAVVTRRHAGVDEVSAAQALGRARSDRLRLHSCGGRRGRRRPASGVRRSAAASTTAQNQRSRDHGDGRTSHPLQKPTPACGPPGEDMNGSFTASARSHVSRSRGGPDTTIRLRTTLLRVRSTIGANPGLATETVRSRTLGEVAHAPKASGCGWASATGEAPRCAHSSAAEASAGCSPTGRCRCWRESGGARSGRQPRPRTIHRRAC